MKLDSSFIEQDGLHVLSNAHPVYMFDVQGSDSETDEKQPLNKHHHQQQRDEEGEGEEEAEQEDLSATDSSSITSARGDLKLKAVANAAVNLWKLDALLLLVDFFQIFALLLVIGSQQAIWTAS